LDLSGVHKKKKKLSLTQAYTKLYWKSKVEAIVNKRWKDKWTSENPDKTGTVPTPTISFRNEVVRALYAKESPEVTEEVIAYRDETAEDTDSEEDSKLDAEALMRKKEVKGIQVSRICLYMSCAYLSFSAIDAIPITLDRALEEVYKQTGLIGSAFFIGPEPQRNGKDISIS
jgi:hypothetical protein